MLTGGRGDGGRPPIKAFQIEQPNDWKGEGEYSSKYSHGPGIALTLCDSEVCATVQRNVLHSADPPSNHNQEPSRRALGSNGATRIAIGLRLKPARTLYAVCVWVSAEYFRNFPLFQLEKRPR